MKSLSVARRYARALYQLAQSEQATNDVLQGLSNLDHAIKESQELARYLLNPLVKPEDKESLAGQISSNKLVLKFVYLLAKRKRLDLLSLVFHEVEKMNDADTGTSRVLIKTSQTLSEPQKRMIEADLVSRFGGKVIGRFEVAKELLGGVWLKMGDKVLDATLKGKIDDLRHTLTHSFN